MGKIIAVNISEEKGTLKKNIHSANLIEDWGVEHDAHAGKWHRQASLLSYEKREGIFTRVLKGGVISEGDEINVVKRPFRAAILTSSDSGYAGEREDLSGPTIRKILENNGYEVVHTILLPDDRDMLAAEMARIADEGIAELLLTTGGTGFSPRDCMPEATMDISERMVPGIPEAIRAYSMTITPRAMLSRATACIRKQTLIINLPGSPKAVKESLEYILPSLQHGLEILTGAATNCARK